MKKSNIKKGFTLAELLIVVAIIAVLVAVAIPIFNAQLEKSKEATDIANLRSAYAEAVATYLSDGSVTTPITVGENTYSVGVSTNATTYEADVTVQCTNGGKSKNYSRGTYTANGAASGTGTGSTASSSGS